MIPKGNYDSYKTSVLGIIFPSLTIRNELDNIFIRYSPQVLAVLVLWLRQTLSTSFSFICSLCLETVGVPYVL